MDLKTEEKVVATIIATKEQLEYAGISEDIVGKEVEVKNIDKYMGIDQPCSQIIYMKKIDNIPNIALTCDYIISTKWLKFK